MIIGGRIDNMPIPHTTLTEKIYHSGWTLEKDPPFSNPGGTLHWKKRDLHLSLMNQGGILIYNGVGSIHSNTYKKVMFNGNGYYKIEQLGTKDYLAYLSLRKEMDLLEEEIMEG